MVKPDVWAAHDSRFTMSAMGNRSSALLIVDVQIGLVELMSTEVGTLRDPIASCSSLLRIQGLEWHEY
jgi:hypothetical protein